MPKKLEYKYVKEYIEQFNYTCLSKEYKDSSQKLELRCPKGHIYEVRWGSFQQGNRCPKCSHEKPRKTLEEVKQYIEQFGYTCLSKEYKRSYSKLELKCPEGHIYKSSWSNFQQGVRCLVCWEINFCGSGNPAWKGGIAAEPYCDAWLDQDYKQSIKDRDKNICLNPFCSKCSKKLIIHHINYNKKNCHPFNLITLCNSCNGKANFDREWHTAWYDAIIYNRYKSRNNIWLR